MQGLLLDPNMPVTPEIPEVQQAMPMAGDPNAMQQPGPMAAPQAAGPMPQPQGGMMGDMSAGEQLMDQQMPAQPQGMGDASTLGGLLGQ
jgi:hypothetical protein